MGSWICGSLSPSVPPSLVCSSHTGQQGEEWTDREGQKLANGTIHQCCSQHMASPAPVPVQAVQRQQKGLTLPTTESGRAFGPDLTRDDVFVRNKPLIFLTVQSVCGQRFSRHLPWPCSVGSLPPQRPSLSHYLQPHSLYLILECVLRALPCETNTHHFIPFPCL